MFLDLDDIICPSSLPSLTNGVTPAQLLAFGCLLGSARCEMTQTQLFDATFLIRGSVTGTNSHGRGSVFDVSARSSSLTPR